MLGRTVAIKKWHPHNMQGQLEFQQEVEVLSKLQHPHLISLLGSCSEAWSLVYEYLPNGSLLDRLFRKKTCSPLIWKDRVRIIAEISSAPCFLHSSKPEKIVHGNLKPKISCWILNSAARFVISVFVGLLQTKPFAARVSAIHPSQNVPFLIQIQSSIEMES